MASKEKQRESKGKQPPQYLLEGYLALDLAHAGCALCGKILADLGAEVIKVEPPGGDPSRGIGPFYQDRFDPEHSYFWLAYNTGKKGITLDITTADGKQIFEELVKRVDFVIESFAPGVMGELGLGYPDVREVNPAIIYVSITPFGQTGPYCSLKGGELVSWASSGYLYMSGDREKPPTWITPGYQASLHGGAEGAAIAMIAFTHRHLTGEGQHADVSIQECMANMNMNAHPYWDFSRIITHRSGPTWDIGQARLDMRFQTRDGYVVVFVLGGGSDTMLTSSKALVRMMAEDNMAPDWLINFDWENEFDTTKLTYGKYKEVVKPIAEYFLTKTKHELFKQAADRRILLAPVNEPSDLISNEQFKAREFWVKVPHPELNDSLTYCGPFAKINNTPLKTVSRAPFIGEHNREIYIDRLGLTAADLYALAQATVI